MYINGNLRVELDMPDEELMNKDSEVSSEKIDNSNRKSEKVRPVQRNFASINDC